MALIYVMLKFQHQRKNENNMGRTNIKTRTTATEIVNYITNVLLTDKQSSKISDEDFETMILNVHDIIDRDAFHNED